MEGTKGVNSSLSSTAIRTNVKGYDFYNRGMKWTNNPCGTRANAFKERGGNSSDVAGSLASRLSGIAKNFSREAARRSGVSHAHASLDRKRCYCRETFQLK